MFDFIPLKNKEKIIKVKQKKIAEFTKLKLELTFMGKKEEVISFVEFVTSPVPNKEGFKVNRNELLEEYALNMQLHNFSYKLPHNDLLLDKGYYCLVSIKIKDVVFEKKEHEYYENKKFIEK